MRLLIVLLLAVSLDAAVLRVCSSGCDYALNAIQTALDDAVAGDVIEIAAGQAATAATGLTLRNKSITAGPHITIRSSGVVNLTPGQRVTPGDAANLAKITTATPPYPVIIHEKGAAFYRFHGIEIVPATGSQPTNVVQFYTANSVGNIADHERADLAHDIVFDQCWIHDAPGSTDGPRRLIMSNLGRMDVTNSWLAGAKNQNSESNAIGGWNGSGPFYFANNYIEAVGITVLFGGAVPNIRGVRATGVQFIGNHFKRPWKWRVKTNTSDPTGTCLYDTEGGEWHKNSTGPTYWHCVEGTWTEVTAGEYSPYYWQKNIFELKNAENVLLEGNYFENAWQPGVQGQYGSMFLFNLVDGDGTAAGESSATIGKVRIRNNYGRRTPWLVSMGTVGSGYFRQHHDITMENNLFDEMGDAPFTMSTTTVEGYKTGSNLFNFPGPTTGVRYLHNTINTTNPVGQNAAMMLRSSGNKDKEAIVAGNIVPTSQGGFYADTGSAVLWSAADSALSAEYGFSRNVVVNNLQLRYAALPCDPGSFYCKPVPILNLMTVNGDTGRMACPSCAVPEYFENSGTQDVGFVNYAARNFRLAANSPYKRWAHLGRDAGADIDVVENSTATAVSGAPNPYLDFKIRAAMPTTDSIPVRYTAPTTAACTLSVSAKSDMSNPVEVTDSGGDRDRLTAATGLTANTRYWWNVTCGAYVRSGISLTKP